ncbi:Dipeptidyl-peptidase 5 [Rhizina undulata]
MPRNIRKTWPSLILVPLLARVASARFTPEDLLSAPRRADAVPNKAGTHAIYYASTYSFESHKPTLTWNILDLKNGETEVLFTGKEITEVAWLGSDENDLIYINTTHLEKEGKSELWIAAANFPKEGYVAATIPAPISNLKPQFAGATLNFAFTALSHPNGTIYDPKKVPTPHSSGLVYDSLFVRHWDTYVKPHKSAVYTFSTRLRDGLPYKTFPTDFKNLFHKEGGLETPVAPFGDASDFDLSKDGKKVVFLSKDPDLNPANHTASYIYLTSFDGSAKPVAINDPKKKDVNGKEIAKGASSSPVISPDGTTVAWLQMYEDGYESDQNKIFLYKDSVITPVAASWDISPSSLTWSTDGKSLYIIAESYGRSRLYSFSLSTKEITELLGEGSVHSVYALSDDSLLLSINSIVSSNGFYLFTPSTKSLTPLLSPKDTDKQLSFLDPSMLSEISFPGAEGVMVHALVIKPSTFDSSKKYPLAFFIHGGPQGSWTDSWSTRWNPAVFAETGYVVVAVNPTGSTGYGKAFTDAIQNQWGGRPYIDLEKAMEYLAGEEFSYIDLSRAVALGASYGGFMINYIQGMPLGRKFKALVCHDGVFSTLNQYTSEELYFPHHDFGGTLFDNRAGYERWDPSNNINNWATPHLIIHSEKDYRLPISEGIAAFNVLQLKGVPSRFLTFPDENHWVIKPENSLMWHREVLGWINQWSGNEEEKTEEEKTEEEKTVEDILKVEEMVSVEGMVSVENRARNGEL